ncbi:MAG TPA: complex I NDUFA9 subunit family protein [Armatimonadota bacterium]|nr:complex I NDUFA9 subunit family protein [Armatimonadota bacterium]
MRVFLTGGTGFIGTHIRQYLASNGHQVVAITRHPMPDEDNITWVTGGINNIDSLIDGMDGCHAVVHLVGIIREHGSVTFNSVHVQGTTNVVNAMRQLGIKQIIYISALDAAQKAPTAYLRSKWLAEEAVRGAGVDYVIFRPSIVFGPGDHFISLLANQLLHDPLIPIIGKGDYQFSPVNITAVAEAITQALLQQEKIGNQVYELCGPESLTYVQLIEIISDYLHKHKAKLFLPVWLVKIGIALAGLLHIPTPITASELTMLLHGSVCDSNNVYADLSIPRITVSQGIKKYL